MSGGPNNISHQKSHQKLNDSPTHLHFRVGEISPIPRFGGLALLHARETLDRQAIVRRRHPLRGLWLADASSELGSMRDFALGGESACGVTSVHGFYTTHDWSIFTEF